MFLSILSIATLAAVRTNARPSPRAAQLDTASLDGVTYVNKGIVGFGFIPSDFKESTGDTLGGIGSAIALKTFSSNGNTSFTGTIVVQPDRGFNIETTIDYQGRQHDIDFVLTPYYGSSDLSFADAAKTLELTYKSTLLYTDRDGSKTTGLDATGVRAASSQYPDANVPAADPPLPIPSSSNNHLSVDCEGLVLKSDGSFWMSDEYGPYIYKFSATGALIQAIAPPQAILPLTKKGALDFTSEDDPKTGRAANQGFEGLTISSDGKTLYALLQSGTVQDDEVQFTRLVAYDISDESVRPELTGEWVVTLPIKSSSGKVYAASELHYVSEGIFLVLARDGKGMGNGDDDSDITSAYKQADLISLKGATNIAASKFDDPSNPVSPKGKLDKSITPVEYVSFVNYIDDDQLARFGLHNGPDADETLIVGKWESLALVSCQDWNNPDDYFLFTAADNDFQTEDGIAVGAPYDAGIDVNNQFLVFRVTLPGASINDLSK
ncbi:hypothetical protein PENSPDRAFT_598027 [Peniophora sp. CONT]|nr:hypothetical protein PENSPDRAFT_598027 [Peniophora sp. CONT]